MPAQIDGDIPVKDLFISYSSVDRSFAERLARDLVRQGIKVWVDVLEMQVGDSLNKKIQQGISSSGYLAVVLSPDSVASRWVEKELNSALELELEKQSVFVLPVLYKDCRIPFFLKDKVYADFRSSYEEGLKTLSRRFSSSVEPKLLAVILSGNVVAIKAAFSDMPPKERSKYENRIQQYLTSFSVRERTSAIAALFALRGKNLFGQLCLMSADSSASVRRDAVFYLGELRSRHAVALLSERMSDPSPVVRNAAREAFRKIPGARE